MAAERFRSIRWRSAIPAHPPSSACSPSWVPTTPARTHPLPPPRFPLGRLGRRRVHHLLRQRRAARAAARRRPAARPFIGSSLETWTSIIGVFLPGSRWATPSAAGSPTVIPRRDARHAASRLARRRHLDGRIPPRCSTGQALTNPSRSARAFRSLLRAVPAGRVRAQPAHAAGDQAWAAGCVEDRSRRRDDLRTEHARVPARQLRHRVLPDPERSPSTRWFVRGRGHSCMLGLGTLATMKPGNLAVNVRSDPKSMRPMLISMRQVDPTRSGRHRNNREASPVSRR